MKRKRSASAGQRIKAWSFSRWRDYDQCPRKARYKHVDRLPDPGSEAMAKGSMVHESAQEYVDGKLRSLPSPLALYRVQFEALRASPDAVTEAEWAFTERLEPTEWLARDAWLRTKVDLHEPKENGVLDIVDYKTGKPHPREDELQLRLYGLSSFAQFDGLEVVRAQLWFLDFDPEQGIEELEFEASDRANLEEQWRDLTAPMLADTTFEPRPGRYCNWCPFRRAQKIPGPCPAA